jgi:hypothetical protein
VVNALCGKPNQTAVLNEDRSPKTTEILVSFFRKKNIEMTSSYYVVRSLWSGQQGTHKLKRRSSSEGTEAPGADRACAALHCPAFHFISFPSWGGRLRSTRDSQPGINKTETPGMAATPALDISLLLLPALLILSCVYRTVRRMGP